jgi:acyl carrier protein
MNMKEQLRSFMVDNFLFGQPLELSDDDSLQDAAIIDSTGVLELVAYLEQTFGLTIDNDELLPDNLDSINRLTRFVQRKLQEQAAPLAVLAALVEPQPA